MSRTTLIVYIRFISLLWSNISFLWYSSSRWQNNWEIFMGVKSSTEWFKPWTQTRIKLMSSTLHQIHEIIQLPKAKEQGPSHPDASWSPELQVIKINLFNWRRIRVTWYDSVSVFSCSCRNVGIKWKLANIKMNDSKSYCGQQDTSKADSSKVQEIGADTEKESPAELGKLQ